MKQHVVLVFALVLVAAQGVPISDQENEIKPEETHAFFKMFEKCTTNEDVTEMMNCAASRMLRSIEKATTEPVINVVPGITLVSDNSISSRQAKEIKDEPLPSNPQEKTNKLVELLVNRTSRFLAGKVLKIQLNKESVARAIEEGRGKMKKMVGPWMLGLGATMITMVPIMLGGLALMASKALMIGKLAFVVSIILFVQYFFTGRNVFPGWFNGVSGFGGYGGYGGYGTTYGTNNVGWGASAQYPYARSLNITPETDKDKNADDLAYSGHQL
ncbi:uncharacterized protein LOC109598923 [Aethina tumida]|uniref:uncharacterized protein LOC109598923 n=1 Tax=Aethina tumida TaxID=116153 RepID=UPI00096AF1B2|nr:uncharacterized protein LOC109598923 [Aethina tumida]